MAVGGHAVIKIQGTTDLTPKKLVNLAVERAKLNKKDEYGNERFYAAIIEESHVIAHKFKNFWILDVYTCGNESQIESALESMISRFEIGEIYGFYTPRGIGFEGSDFEKQFKLTSSMREFRYGHDHILLDLNVDGDKIKTVDNIVDYARKLDEYVVARYQFAPYGASGILKTGKKLITFHSWPEYGLLTIDFIGYRAHLDKVKEFVDNIGGSVLSEWNLGYFNRRY